MKTKKLAEVWQDRCVACGCCADICPRGAMYIKKGICAEVNNSLCVGCGLCARECPASLISVKTEPSAAEPLVASSNEAVML